MKRYGISEYTLRGRHVVMPVEQDEGPWVRFADAQSEYQRGNGQLGELLAIIHRDGGHYEDAHGTEKAAEDAKAIISNMLVERDTLKTAHDALQKDAARRDELCSGAFEEACKRYPDSISAIVWLSTACGPLGVITQEHIDAAFKLFPEAKK